MLDWWFPWHSVGSDLRYKIWDPEDHYFARAYPASYVVDPAVSLLPPGASIPPEVPKGLFAHNIKEFTNLAAILPTLYAEERGTF